MHLRRKPYFAVLCLAGLVSGQWSAQGQVVVVQTKAVAQLADDVGGLIKGIAPRLPQTRAILNQLDRIKAGVLLKGLDLTRPPLVGVSFPGKPGRDAAPIAVIAVPVRDFRVFLSSIQELGVVIDDQPPFKGFSHTATLPNGMRFYVLQSRRYALLSWLPAGADALRKLDLASWQLPTSDPSMICARLRLGELPANLKTQFLKTFDERMARDQRRTPNETDVAFRSRIQTQRTMAALIRTLVNEGAALTLRLGTNPARSNLSVALAIAGKAGTSIGDPARELKQRKSLIADLTRDAAVAVQVNLPLSPGVRTMLASAINAAAAASRKAAKSDEERQQVDQVIALIGENLQGEDIDFARALRQVAPAASRDSANYLIQAAMKLTNGDKFVKAYQALKGKADGRDASSEFNIDFASAADGTKIHRSISLSERDARAFAFVGGPFLFFAFRPQYAGLTLGKESLKPFQAWLDQAAARRTAAPASPLEISAHLAALRQLAAFAPPQVSAAITNASRSIDPRQDRLRLALSGADQEFLLRLDSDVPALQTLLQIYLSLQDQ